MLSGMKRILIDPGHASCFDHVSRGLARLGLTSGDIDLVMATHAHPDHVEAIQFFDRNRTLFALHERDWRLVKEMLPFLGASLSIGMERFEPDFFLAEGELKVGDATLEIYHTPGHSPGSITIYHSSERALFTGDLVFRGGVGRTDIPGGDPELLKDSIRRISKIEADWFLPGHGEPLSGADEIWANFRQVERAWFGYL